MPVSSSLKIGEVATRSGTSIDTIRYYERRCLLPAPARRPSGYRCYGPDAPRRLHFILRAKALGFTLEEIGELLGISAQHDVAAIRAAAARKLAGVDARLAELQRIRDALSTLVDHCPGHGPVADCPILAALNAPELDHD
ncbi:MAG: heavy metal-responsive transcriptional regulator [Nevskiaceae bacterium]|nr:MAG: heavy metal-responsive transcriptional regulator [Nevskiaceae bacterium]TBR73102.1 MAG: heavy metal-responsive transcriptional regulator [Nevskiaceae bacterium]